MEKNLKNAWRIGSFCILTYLASYITRNILSVSTPEMLEEAFFTKEYVGMLSSTCFIFYAVGQLINGFIGDMVSPKYMVAMGLGLSSVSIFSVPLFENRTLHVMAFMVIGFGLSMLRGPLMKVISENTLPKHARMICTLFSMASFAGPLVASLLSIVFKWRTVFVVAGIVSVLTTIISVSVMTVLERHGEIKFTLEKSVGFGSILGVFKLKDFVFYMLISGIGEVAGTSITFWIPTYATEYLKFSTKAASTIYSVVSFSALFAPFIALIIYEKLIKDGVKLALLMYSVSAIAFIVLRIITIPILNIILLIIAKTAAAAAAGVVWGVYIPGLAKSGKVSSANGVIDAAGYAMASISNMIFSGGISKFGWGGIVIIWCVCMFVGVAASFIKIMLRKKYSCNE